MVQIIDVSVEKKPKPVANDRWRFSIFSLIFLGLAIAFLILAVVFIALFVVTKDKSDDLQEKLLMLENTEGISCSRMRQCSRERSGTPPLLIISMDGFANRYINPDDTPTLVRMGECGGHAEFMYPSFPSKTFPNHYTIATGLYPGSHGIVDNEFEAADGRKYDSLNGTFYGGEPIWNTVVKNGKESKTMMWLGSYDKIDEYEASYHTSSYNKTLAFIRKIDNVTEWLTSDNPPALSMLYLEEPDGAGHAYGPETDEVREAANKMDGLLNYIMRRLSKFGVLGCTNIVLVSDHGMRRIKKFINMESISPEYGTAHLKAANNVFFYQNVSTEPLKCKNGSEYRVYETKEEVPLRYHYDHKNIGFPYISGNPGMIFTRNRTDYEYAINSTKKGNHGWDNMDTQMQAMFYTIGPSIKENVTLPHFQNIQLYNLFADLMNIPPAPNNGTAGLLDEILVNPPKRERPSYPVYPCRNVSFEDCSDPSRVITLNEVAGFIYSSDPYTCHISVGNVYLLYSTRLNRVMGFQAQSNDNSLSGQIVTKLNGVVIGPNCGASNSSAFDVASSLKLTWTEFESISLVNKAISTLNSQPNVRLDVGVSPSSDYAFVIGFSCNGEGWREEKDYCNNEKDTVVEAYAIPRRARENFNCLDDSTLLLDYRVTISDIEKLTSLSLLPQSMPISQRNRISLSISSQIFA